MPFPVSRPTYTSGRGVYVCGSQLSKIAKAGTALVVVVHQRGTRNLYCQPERRTPLALVGPMKGQGILPIVSTASGECLDAAEVVPAEMGSFALLRMTGWGRGLYPLVRSG